MFTLFKQQIGMALTHQINMAPVQQLGLNISFHQDKLSMSTELHHCGTSLQHRAQDSLTY